jgi:hypothetical protein
METYKEQVQSEALNQMADSVAQLEVENTKLKKDIDKLIAEITIANKFIISQKEYYEKLMNQYI